MELDRNLDAPVHGEDIEATHLMCSLLYFVRAIEADVNLKLVTFVCIRTSYR